MLLVRLLNINLRSLERISTQEGFRGKYTFLNIPTHIKQGTNVSVLPGFGYITDSLSVRPSVRYYYYPVACFVTFATGHDFGLLLHGLANVGQKDYHGIKQRTDGRIII